jgi:hypothetical protein
MPLTRIFMRRGKSPAHRKAVLDGVYAAMRETFNVPDEDRFMSITQHDGDEFLYGTDYLDMHRTDDLVMIQITANNSRTTEQK